MLKQRFRSKTDLRVHEYNTQNIQMYNGIRNARSSLRHVFHLPDPDPSCLSQSTRRLNPDFQRKTKAKAIKKENKRLYDSMMHIFASEAPKPASRCLKRNSSASSLSSSRSFNNSAHPKTLMKVKTENEVSASDWSEGVIAVPEQTTE